MSETIYNEELKEAAEAAAEAVGKEILVQVYGADIINDGNLVLSNVNMEIAKGEWVYLLGKVGSGKS